MGEREKTLNFYMFYVGSLTSFVMDKGDRLDSHLAPLSAFTLASEFRHVEAVDAGAAVGG